MGERVASSAVGEPAVVAPDVARRVDDRRGPCRTTDEFEAVAASFRARRADMMALLDSMRDLEPAARSEARDYLEGFFRAIEKPTTIKKQFVDSCKPAPTM